MQVQVQVRVQVYLGVLGDEGGVDAGLLQEVSHQLVQQPRRRPGRGALHLRAGEGQVAG